MTRCKCQLEDDISFNEKAHIIEQATENESALQILYVNSKGVKLNAWLALRR